MHYFIKQKRHELLKKDTKNDAKTYSNYAGVKSLIHENLCNVLFAHAENVVQSKLFIAALHEKAVAVHEKNKGKYTDHHNSHCNDHFNIRAVWNGVHPLILVDKQHHVKHGDAHHAGKHIGNVCALVLFYVYCGKPCK